MSVSRLFARKKTNEAWTNIFGYVTVRLELAPVRPSVQIVTVGTQQKTLARGQSPEVPCDRGEQSLGHGGTNTSHLNSVIPISYSKNAMPTVYI